MKPSLAYVGAALAVAAGTTLAGCTPKEPAQGGAAGGGQEITVTATDSSCQLSKTEGTTGPVTFNVTNNGSKVTEFYVYDKGDRASARSKTSARASAASSSCSSPNPAHTRPPASQA